MPRSPGSCPAEDTSSCSWPVRPDQLQALADELATRPHVIPADLSDGAARAGLLGEIEARGLTPQILVNNAGFSTMGPVHQSDPEVERNMLELDVVALADLCARFLPGMVRAAPAPCSTSRRRPPSSRCPARRRTARRRRSCSPTRAAWPPS